MASSNSHVRIVPPVIGGAMELAKKAGKNVAVGSVFEAAYDLLRELPEVEVVERIRQRQLKRITGEAVLATAGAA
jgi:hypothetical protein